MISQRQLREWSQGAVSRFQSLMPAVEAPYPEIHIVSDRTMYSVRETELKRTQSPATGRYEIPAMELLHGPCGDSILIYQKCYTGGRWDPHDSDAKNRFQHFLWHEHGHFFALSKENPDDNFIRFMDQKPHPEEYEALLGYSFWTEFIAEVIACRVTPDPVIDWERFYWYTPKNELNRFLSGAFNTSDYGISWYDLAFYFARILADKTTTGFIDAAKKGLVKVRRVRGVREEKLTFEEAGIDPTGLDGLNSQLLKPMEDLREYLEIIINDEEYWRVSLEDLDTIGTVIHHMERIMAMDDMAVRLRDRIHQ